MEEDHDEYVVGASYMQICRPCYEELGSPEENWFALKLK
jgi:hypothetical protein